MFTIFFILRSFHLKSFWLSHSSNPFRKHFCCVYTQQVRHMWNDANGNDSLIEIKNYMNFVGNDARKEKRVNNLNRENNFFSSLNFPLNVFTVDELTREKKLCKKYFWDLKWARNRFMHAYIFVWHSWHSFVSAVHLLTWWLLETTKIDGYLG